MAARIGTHAWETTGLGPARDWPPNLRCTVDMMLAHGFPMVVLWGPELVQIYNDAYAAIIADKHPTALGMPTRACWPEAWHINEAVYARVWQGETVTFEERQFELNRHGTGLESAWFSVTYSPLRGADGRVDGVLATLFETTAARLAEAERASAERQRRESDERLALVFKMLPVGVCIVDPDSRILMANDVMRSYLPTTKLPSLDTENQPRWQGWHEDGTPLQPHEFPAARALRGDTVVPGQEFAYTHADGRQTWTRVAAAPLRDAGGHVNGALSVVVDIDELKRRTEQLRVNEERFRQFSAASSDVLWIRDAHTLEVELLSSSFDAMYGLPRQAVLGELKHWAALVVPEDREAVIAHLQQVRRGQSRVQEYRIQRRSDGVFRWCRDTAFPLYDSQGRVSRVAGIASDITEERQSAEHQRVLVAELQHRVRNLMAMINAIVSRTQAGATSVEDYAQRLSGRVMSLARTQALLTRADNVGICLRQLIEEELAAVAPDPGAYQLDGPEVTVPPKAAEVLSLAIHELAANAFKHGALAQAGGRVVVTWTHRQDQDTPWLELEWQEHRPAGAAWAPPARRGFGSVLVEERVPYELAGVGAVEHLPGGTRARIGFPLRGRDSILQTDAPRRAGIDGGTLDLVGEPSGAGRSVLVVDADYYRGHDLAAALRSTGASIVGPFTALPDALHAVAAQPPERAVVDVGLGQQASLALVSALQAAGTAFVLTRHDTAVLPDALGDVPCLAPAAAPQDVVRALADTAAR